jgi:DNA-binding transcriptional LysR family regulator
VVWRFGKKTERGVPIPVQGRFAANNSEAVALMARRGIGLALLAEWIVAEDLRRGRLVPLLEDFAPPPAPVYALSPPGRFSATTVRALTDHLAGAIGARLTAGS